MIADNGDVAAGVNDKDNAADDDSDDDVDVDDDHLLWGGEAQKGR